MRLPLRGLENDGIGVERALLFVVRNHAQKETIAKNHWGNTVRNTRLLRLRGCTVWFHRIVKRLKLRVILLQGCWLKNWAVMSGSFSAMKSSRHHPRPLWRIELQHDKELALPRNHVLLSATCACLITMWVAPSKSTVFVFFPSLVYLAGKYLEADGNNEL